MLSSPNFFPSEKDAPWEKAHGRLERRRIKRLAVTPEEIGLTGCPSTGSGPCRSTGSGPERSRTGACRNGWQILAIQRERLDLARARAQPKAEEENREPELGYYVTSLGHRETSDQALLEVVRGHWSAIENGTHHLRDASLGEDRSRIAQPSAARVMATLRNLAIGIDHHAQNRSATKATSLPSW